MKAPDKIYLVESDNIKGEVTSNFASSTPFRRHGSIAYLRKDALIKWAEDMKEANDGICDTSYYQEFIDKLKSM